MKQIIAYLSATLLLFNYCVFPAQALNPEELTATAAVLMDAETGQVLYNKNMDERMYPASTTKILTGLIAVEELDPAVMLTTSETAIQILPNSSKISLDVGEQLSVRDAMYALMLPSANDAANVLAEGIDGSQQAFANRLNLRLQEIGALSTHFTNAHGLPDDDHYTTAYDMALITREASYNQDFMHYFGTGRYTMGPTNMKNEERPLTNQQFMLLPDQGWAYNPQVLGGKVGYTDDAKHTMSTVARQGDRTLVAVVLQTGKDEKFYDTQMLFDFGFGQFSRHSIPTITVEQQRVAITDGEIHMGSVLYTLQEDIQVLLHDSMSVNELKAELDIPDVLAPDEEPWGNVVVTAAYSSQREIPTVVAEVPLDMDITLYDLNMDVEQPGGSMGFWLNPLFWGIGLGVSALLFVIFMISLAAKRRRIKRRQQRRLEALNRSYNRGRY